MMRNILRYKLLLFLLVMAALCGGYAAGADMTTPENPVWAYRSGVATPYAKYVTLAAALNNSNLQDNDTIEFHGNTTETERATISKNNITIKSMEGACCTADYSSFSVSSGMDGAITVNGKGLNIRNVVFQNFSNPESSLSQKATLFYVDNGAEVTFGVNCTVTNIQCPHTSYGAAVVIEKGTVTVDGATFSNNYGMHGAAIYVNLSGTLVINDTPDDGAVTRFFGNNVKDIGGCGGAIANRDGTTTINSGEFHDNYGLYGGSINNTGSLTISGGRFYNHVNCPAVANSGCQYCHVNGNPVFENNYGVSAGAAIQFQNWKSSTVGDCVIDGGTFRNNIVTWKGGAICLHNNPDGNHPVEVTINGGIFENNKSLQDGGAIDILPTCKLTITGGTFTGNVADIDKEDEVIGRGNAIWHNGNLMVSGNPVFGEDQDVHLASMENVITKSGDINASVLVPVSMPSEDEVRGRDILVSSTGHNVVKTDLQRFDVILETTSLAAGFTPSDAVTSTPVIELKKGGPFYVVSLEEDFPTLQEAVDAAATTDEIHVLPCEDFGVTEYGASYATYDTSKIGQYGGEVYITGKSLTIKSENGKDTAPLKDFEIIFIGCASANSYTIDDVKFIGQSMLDFDNQPETAIESANYQFGDITIQNCSANVSTTTNRMVNGHALGNDSGNSFIVFPQQGGGTTQSLTVTGNTIVTNNAARCIYGGARPVSAQIYDNTFGSPSGRYTDNAVVFERFPAGITSNIEMYNNVCYSGATNCGIFYLNSDNAASVNITVHDNEVFGSTYVDMENRTRILSSNKLKPIGTTAAGIASGKTVTYHNYVNGYCDNEVNKGSTGVTYDTQCGHTYDEHIKDMLAGKTKVEDIYQLGKADVFAGSTHSNPIIELGDDRYCDRCDELIELEATFTYTAVCKKELAEGESFGSVTPTEENVGKVTGTPAGSVAEAADGFRFIGWFDNEACEGTALSTELTYVPPVVRDEDELLIGDDFYALFDSAVRTLIIEKSGLNAGDRAIFTVTKKGDTAPMYIVPVTAGADGSGNVTIKDVAVGEYTVAETSWSWAYEKVQPLTQDITENNTFTFKNTPKKDIPPHAEVEKNNVLKEKKN